MTNKTEKYLEKLSKKQLIFIIKNLQSALFHIGEICVSESKGHVDSIDSVELIRKKLMEIDDLSRFHIYNDEGLEELNKRIKRKMLK